MTKKKRSAVDPGTPLGKKFVAGVFVDPETGQFEVAAGDEGIEPYGVMLGAISSYVRKLYEALGVAHSAGPRIARPRDE